jgi:hypothetical protein
MRPKGYNPHSMTERWVTALLVDAILLLCVFEGAVGRSFREQYPIAGNIAIGVGLAACAAGTWRYMKSHQKSTERDARQNWLVVSFLVAIVVAFGREPRNAVLDGLGLFLLFAIGKVMLHDRPK